MNGKQFIEIMCAGNYSEKFVCQSGAKMRKHCEI